MHYDGLEDFLRRGRAALARGPVAVILAEDGVALDTTLRHHQQQGFRALLCLMPDEIALAPDLVESVHRIRHDPWAKGALRRAVDRLTDAAPGTWFFYCYNAEFLFYPFCETRTVGEMLTFHAEERRDAMLTFVVDLYAPDLAEAPNAVSLDDAMLDRTGYYALARPDPANHDHPKERQLDFFGGLRWRFEEHVPPDRRKIDRVGLFRAKPGLRLRADHTFSDEEYNTYACPWHNNLTAAVASFRTAKALRANPGSRDAIASFRWRNSVPFEWHSRQLLDLGLMEPGQWF
ncbi:glycosyltransferase family 2 protein [Rhodosalinus sp.]|uniref:glycosyltransferase family 2 protein n=1 Tax=Rhodosalinus sp. TaxID=2047741 RepID=UPI00356AA419